MANMMISTIVISFLFIAKLNCLNINGKDYKITHHEKDGVSTRTIHTMFPPVVWAAKSVYNKTYMTTGWDTFDVETNPEIEDAVQAFLAGYLEGLETQAAIYDHFYNIIPPICNDDMAICERINQYLDTNTQWIKQMVRKHAATDIYWRQVDLFYQQIAGVATGYSDAAPADQILDLKDMMWMSFSLDIDDIKSALKNETNKSLNTHCSAIIKLLPGQSDILVAHNTWTGYEMMKRMIKRYTLPYKQVIGTSVSFSGYPGILTSADDFMIVNSGLVLQETTNYNNNASLWKMVEPVGQVMMVVRLSVANRLADGGSNWTKIFSQYNSGTYNNQWMIVDMNKFSPGSMKPGLLWVLEQIPGYTRQEDQTDILTSQGYWASYNKPFYKDIFELMGHPELVKQYGDFFTHDKTPRALIFKRDQDKVVDIDSMMTLMQYNDFENDPLSRCDCDPPYSSENTIAARNDLNPINGTYPFPALGHRCSGAIDAKVTSYKLSKSLSMLAVCGPTTGNHLPPFQWSRSDFNLKLSHRGHPDIFQFQPILISWPQENTIQ